MANDSAPFGEASGRVAKRETRCVFTRIHANNFKSWQRTGDIGLAPVTGFFGTNSSGKTSLLQLLLLMKQTSTSADRKQVLNLGGDERSPVSLGLIRDVVFDHDLDRHLSMGFWWNTPAPIEPPDPTSPGLALFSASQLSFGVELAIQQDQLYVEEFRYDADDVKLTMEASKTTRHRRQPEYQLKATVQGRSDYLTRVQGRAWPLPPPAKCYGFPDEVLAYFRNAEFVGALELEA